MNTQQFKHKTRGRLATCLVAAAITLFTAGPVYAVDGLGVFELDGNATDGVGGGDDWENVNFTPFGSSIAHTGVVSDLSNTTIFTTGGSKDIRDISQWRHTDGSVPDKDEITNAYAAAYNVSNDLVIYAGLDRFANNGDANAGFWFLQQNVSPLPNGTFGPGVHSVGDILVVVEFSGGGSVATAKVFRWNGSTIGLVSSTGDCSLAHAPNNPCAKSNSGDIQLYWPYTPKFPDAGTPSPDGAPPGSFVEVGVNVSQIARDAGAGTPCIATFLAETRSSSEANAQLKDFVMHDFPVCGLEVTKVCEKGGVLAGGIPTGLNADATKFVYKLSGTVFSTGFGSAHDVDIVDQTINNGDILATINLVPTAPPATPWGPVERELSTQISSNTVIARGAASDGGPQTIESDPSHADCPPINVSPDISVTKVCRTCLQQTGGKVVVNVLAEGQVCNESTLVPLTQVSVTDDAGTPVDLADDFVVQIGNLAKKGLAGACQSYSTGPYAPETTSNNIPENAIWTDTVTARGNSALLGFAEETNPGGCKLCPDRTVDDQVNGLSIPCPALAVP
jgi:hypothetical protein